MRATTYRAINAINGNFIISSTAFVDGKTLDDAVAALVAAHGVVVLPSGTLSFANKSGTPVSLYLRIDPEQTEMGHAALLEHRRAEEKRRAAEAARRKVLDDMIDQLGVDAAIERLRATPTGDPS